jgi:hypothetical protein
MFKVKAQPIDFEYTPVKDIYHFLTNMRWSIDGKTLMCFPPFNSALGQTDLLELHVLVYVIY